MVNDIKLNQGRDGLFVSMPSRRKKNGEFKDVAHPLNSETRRRIEQRILAEFEKLPEGVGLVRRLTSDGTVLEPVTAVAGEPPLPVERSLAEVEEYHLSDSFWSVS
jgi:DNA-binding cell septation regulator SpoVG